MGVSIQDRTDFLNMLDGCRTEQQLFSRLTFAVMFHQTDPDAREDLLDDVRGAACNMQLPAVNYKIDQWLNTCKQAWQADPAAFMAAVNADAKQRKLALEGSAAQPGLLADVPMQSVAWLVPQLLPLGEVSLLGADGGTGKVLKARLLAAGADMNRVLVLTADDYFGKTGQPLTLKDQVLADFAAKAGPLLLIVDPLQSFLPAGVEMASRNQMRSILLPLKAIAAAQQCAVLLVMHSNKKQGVSGRKRLADSSDIWDMARSVLMMGRSNSDGKIYLSHEKSSYSRPQQTVLLHIEDVELDGVRTAQAVFDGYTDKKDADFIKEPRVRQAQTKEDTRDAILNVLAESRLGSMASPQLKSEVMREIGCSEGTYNRAYGDLVKSHAIAKYQLNQKGGVRGWFTRLPYRSETDDKLTYI